MLFRKNKTKDIAHLQREPKPYEMPYVPYKRSAILVKQSRLNWVFEMLRRGQGRVVLQYFVIWTFIVIAIVVSIIVILKMSGLLDMLFGGL